MEYRWRAVSIPRLWSVPKHEYPTPDEVGKSVLRMVIGTRKRGFVEWVLGRGLSWGWISWR